VSASALPPLREDLKLYPGPVGRDGSPSWTIFDPVRNRYSRIGQSAFDLLRFWYLGKPSAILAAIAKETGRTVSTTDLEWMLTFLRTNLLLQRVETPDVSDLETIADASDTSWHQWFLHRYLFFRIPLVRPQVFLDWAFPAVEKLYSRTVFWALLVLAIVGGFLVLRQWENFQHTFLYFFTWDGLLWYGGALILAKIIHELGHAFTARRYGCRIPTMGVAFLVMWPVLYTDTSDAWRLTDRREKLAIGAAGITAELALAVLATFLWSFLPDGSLKSAVFVLASVTWIMTVAINLNPFMRFDGYYLLSDWLEVENLQDRSFALGRWWIRERLFGFGEAPPEAFPERLQVTLVVYALCTWVYRFFLFLGIALLVYAFFFKALGLFLFAVEMVWFIGFPIWREMREWAKRKEKMVLNHQTLRIGLLGGAGLLILVVPWQHTIHVPALWDAQEQAVIYAPIGAQVTGVSVQRGEDLEAGQILIKLHSPTLQRDIELAQQQLALSRALLERQAANVRERQKRSMLQQDLERARTELNSLLETQKKLTLKSPISGQLIELDRTLKPGVWINERLTLGIVQQAEWGRLRGYVSEKELGRFSQDSQAIFYPDSLEMPSFSARVESISEVNTRYLQVAQLASVHGGPIAVEEVQEEQRRLVPRSGLYEVVFALDQPAPAFAVRGDAHIEGVARSLLERAFSQVWSVLIREAGF